MELDLRTIALRFLDSASSPRHGVSAFPSRPR